MSEMILIKKEGDYKNKKSKYIKIWSILFINKS